VSVLWVFLGAAVGAPLRYLTDRAVQTRHDTVFPWGTFTVNVAGCLVIGALAGAGHVLSPTVLTVLGTGFCGALTTYSTFSYETLRLIEQRAYFYAVMNVLVSVVAAVGAVLLGLSSYVPTYVQDVLGTGPLVAGFALATLTMGWPISASQSGRVGRPRNGRQ
jgi:CrcB protein